MRKSGLGSFLVPLKFSDLINVSGWHLGIQNEGQDLGLEPTVGQRSDGPSGSVVMSVKWCNRQAALGEPGDR